MSILIVAEQRDGALNKMSLETVAAGQQMGAALSVPVYAAVFGKDAAKSAQELAAAKLERVHAIEHELLADYTPDAACIALRQLIARHSPRIVLFPHTYQVRDYAPELATSLDRVLVSDAIGHKIEGDSITLIRQLFQGKVNADVKFTGEPPFFASLQAGAYRADGLESGSAPVETFTPEIKPEQVRSKPLELFASPPARSISGPRTSSFRWAEALRNPRTCRSSNSSPNLLMRRLRPRDRSAITAGSPWSARWAAPARQ